MLSAHTSPSKTSLLLSLANANMGGHNWALRRSSNEAAAASVGIGESGGTSAVVRAFNSFSHSETSSKNRVWTLHIPMKRFSCVLVDENFACFKESCKEHLRARHVHESCTRNCPGRTMCPDYSTSSENHVYVLILRVTPASRRFCRYVLISLKCRYAFAKNMMTMSK